MTILIDNHLFGTKDKDGISILFGSALGNPFKIGDQNCITGSKIETKQDLCDAYEGWMLSRINSQIKPTIEALDEIAFKILDRQDVTLICTCNSEHCHGYVIKRIIEDAIARNSH